MGQIVAPRTNALKTDLKKVTDLSNLGRNCPDIYPTFTPLSLSHLALPLSPLPSLISQASLLAPSLSPSLSLSVLQQSCGDPRCMRTTHPIVSPISLSLTSVTSLQTLTRHYMSLHLSLDCHYTVSTLHCHCDMLYSVLD